MTIPTQNERPQQPAPVAAVPSAAPAPERAADRVYSLGEVDDPPRALTRVQASYTEATAKARVQGAVLLECVVWPDGRAHSIEVVKSIGHSELDRNAMQALEKWRFVPARKDGVPVKVRLRIEHAFNPPSLRGAPSLTKDR
jgi:protein TonB